jgi:hypothetical protein
MNGKRALRRGLWALLAVTATLYLGRLFAPGSALYENLLSNLVLTAIASPVKLVFQAVAIVMAWRVRGRFEPGNPSRAAWTTLAAALLLTLLGQLYLAPFQLRLHESPFPSGGDVFFVLSYPLLFAALVLFLKAYGAAGLPMPSAGERMAVGLVMLVVLGGIAWRVLAPIAAGPWGWGTALNLFYPGADLVLLVPALHLVKASFAFRGGQLWRIWVQLLGGIVFLCGADVLFAYFSSLGQSALDPLLHSLYLAAYCLLAQAALAQVELLED